MLISCVDDNNGFGSHEAVAWTHFGLILPSAAAVMQMMDTFADATSLEVRKQQGLVDDRHSFRKRTRTNASALLRQHFEYPYSPAPT